MNRTSLALNHIFFLAKQNSQSDFKAILNSKLAGKGKTKKPFLANLAINLCDFKMDLIKWQLN